MERHQRAELRWLDAFPWLETGFGQQKAKREGLDPCGEVPTSDVELEFGISVVRDIGIDLLAARWTLSDLFPQYPADRDISDLRLTAATVKALNSRGAEVAQDLASLSMRDAGRVWNLGRDALESLVFGMAAASLEDVADGRGLKEESLGVEPNGRNSEELGRAPSTHDHSGECVGPDEELEDSEASPRVQDVSVGRLSVRRADPVRGKVAVAARFRIPDVVIDGDVVLVRLPIAIAQKAIRQGTSNDGDAARPDVLPVGAAVVRARSSWFLEGNELGIVKAADLVSGGAYLNAAIAADVDSVLCIALFAEASDGDTAYLEESGSPEPTQVGTNTERMAVTTRPVVVTIRSEPFVTPTRFGYTPAVLVSRGSSPRQHLLVSAKSLGDPLEEIRVRRGGLTGVVVELSKESDERSSKYIVNERSSES